MKSPYAKGAINVVDKPVIVKSKKKWLAIIGGFVAAQMLFIAIDGTFLDPRLNNIGNFASRIMNNSFFTEWFTLYENPIYKIITTLAILQIIYISVNDIVSFRRVRR